MNEISYSESFRLLHCGNRDEFQLFQRTLLEFRTLNILDECFCSTCRLTFCHIVTVSPYWILAFDDIVSSSFYAVEFHSFYIAVHIYKVNVANCVRSCCNCCFHVAARTNFFVVVLFLRDVAAIQCFQLIVNARARTEGTSDDNDVCIVAANLFPVRDFRSRSLSTVPLSGYPPSHFCLRWLQKELPLLCEQLDLRML